MKKAGNVGPSLFLCRFFAKVALSGTSSVNTKFQIPYIASAGKNATVSVSAKLYSKASYTLGQGDNLAADTSYEEDKLAKVSGVVQRSDWSSVVEPGTDILGSGNTALVVADKKAWIKIDKNQGTNTGVQIPESLVFRTNTTVNHIMSDTVSSSTAPSTMREYIPLPKNQMSADSATERVNPLVIEYPKIVLSIFLSFSSRSMD